MDPDALLSDLLAAVESREWELVRQLTNELMAWLDKGGRPPITLGPESMGRHWHRLIANFTCYAAKLQAAENQKRRRRRKSDPSDSARSLQPESSVPSEIDFELDGREVVTLLAALLFWQEEMSPHEAATAQPYFDSLALPAIEPLNAAEISTLISQLRSLLDQPPTTGE